MMRSLWSGVSGLQSHQVAMDVEGNNIANVNTTGFKYSRANFGDMMSQTSQVATEPSANGLGGKNAIQVGLGATTTSTTRIFSQGSIQSTDKVTDLAIQGDGFFVVSPDGGKTYNYTRNGDFNFDANGNFVDNNGYVAQGWTRDPDTGEIDNTGSIESIVIPPGLTMPANATSEINLKANLNSGNSITNKAPIYELDRNNQFYDKDGDGILSDTELHDENLYSDTKYDIDGNVIERGQDMGAVFDENGESLEIQDGQGMWVSYATATTLPMTIDVPAAYTAGDRYTVDFMVNGEQISGSIQLNDNTPETASTTMTAYIADLINSETEKTGVIASVNNKNELTLTNQNSAGTTDNMKNIDFQVISGGSLGLDDQNIITAFKYNYTTSNPNTTHSDRESVREFKTTEDLRDVMQTDARLWTDYEGNGFDDDIDAFLNRNDGVEITVNEQGKFQINNPSGDAFNIDDGDIVDGTQSHTFSEITTTTANKEVFQMEFGTVGSSGQDIYFDGFGDTSAVPALPAIRLAAGSTPSQAAQEFVDWYNALPVDSDGNGTSFDNEGVDRNWEATYLGNGRVEFRALETGSVTNIENGGTGNPSTSGNSTWGFTGDGVGSTIPGMTVDAPLIQGSDDQATIQGNSPFLTDNAGAGTSPATFTEPTRIPAEGSIGEFGNAAATMEIVLGSDMSIPNGSWVDLNGTSYYVGTEDPTDYPATPAGTIAWLEATDAPQDLIDAVNAGTITGSTNLVNGTVTPAAGTIGYIDPSVLETEIIGGNPGFGPADGSVPPISMFEYDTVNGGVIMRSAVTDTVAPATGNTTITGIKMPEGAGATIPGGSLISDDAAAAIIGLDTQTAHDHDMYLTMTEYSDASNDIAINEALVDVFKGMQGSLIADADPKSSDAIYMANHGTSIDIYDSLGSKHTMRFEFTKDGYSTLGGNQWSMKVTVPEPGDISGGVYPYNIINGTVTFDDDGSILSVSPSSVTYSANNGSTGGQTIELNFGNSGEFDGLTSFDSESSTSGVAQDGYTGGDLTGVRVDQTGTIAGSFSNGRSMGLAQVSMAKFANNAGLSSEGGSLFTQTANSGEPIIGQANSGGRGLIQSSSLEMSNVDLSRSLTQLIVVQRGFQANSKTITTSDEMLNTLIQLK